MTLYDLTRVQVRFGALTALDIDRLTLPENTACALLGPNGSGKTTLLHVLALLTPPTIGVVRFLEETVSWREKTLLPLRRNVALVDQHPIMFSTTVVKNVAYGPKMRGESRSTQKKIALECLDRVGMQEYADRPAHRLSGGETQRVAIARALACRPQVLLLDEPTAGVDIENQSVVEKIIFDLCSDRRMSILFSTHNPIQAERLARSKVFLSAGRLAAPAAENRFPATVLQQNGFLDLIMNRKTHAKNAPEIVPAGSFVSIDPEKIRVYADAPGDPGQQNGRFMAKVLQMSAETDRIRVVLDAGKAGGTLLTALLKAGDIRQNLIVPGDSVQITLDPDALRIEKNTP